MEKTKLQEMYEEVEKLAGEAAAALTADERKSVIDAKKKAATEAVAKYNCQLAEETFKKWMAAGNPVETALRCRYLPEAIRVEYKKTKNGNRYVQISPAKIKIDASQLEEVVGVDKFVLPDWYDRKCCKLADLLIAWSVKQLKIPGFEWPVDQAVKEFNFKKNADPSSPESMHAAIQETIDSILFLPAKDKDGNVINAIQIPLEKDENGKPFSPAWNYFQIAMRRKGKLAGGINISGAEYAPELLFDVIYLNLNNMPYSIDLGD